MRAVTEVCVLKKRSKWHKQISLLRHHAIGTACSVKRAYIEVYCGEYEVEALGQHREQLQASE